MISSIVESQESEDAYSFDAVIEGANLDNYSDQKWVCYYFFYELEHLRKFTGDRENALATNTIPFRIEYGELALG